MTAFNSSYLVVPLIITFITIRRYRRSSKGSAFSVTSIFLRPAIYSLITIGFLFIVGLENAIMLIAAMLIGLLIGLILGKKSDIFEKDGKVMYKRSNEITIMWMIGFIVRLTLDYFFNPALTAPNFSINSFLFYERTVPLLFVADLLLAFTAGLLLGEAWILYNNHNKRQHPKA
jgi:membrane protein CcdC involved in cytochrome C biogenesis